MKELTLQYALENKLTPIDYVRFFDSSLSDEECDFILREQTYFIISDEAVIKKLNECFKNRTK